MTSETIVPRPMVLEEFTPLVGRAFDVDCTPAAVAIILVEASPSRHPGPTDRPAFSLLFRSGPDIMLVSGIYTMRNQSFGPDAIHIAPVQPPFGAEPGYYYEAIFN